MSNKKVVTSLIGDWPKVNLQTQKVISGRSLEQIAKIASSKFRMLSAVCLLATLGLSILGWAGSSASAAAAPQEDSEEVLLDNGFRVIFDGVEYHADSTSTWFYTVEELPEAKDLSNWVLEIPFCAPILDASPEPWEIVDPDPNAQLSGVKWETGDGFQHGQFWVTLDTTGQVGITHVAAKGPKVAWGEIAGPTCVEEPPQEPPNPGDEEPPTIEWIAPVAAGETFNVQEGETVELVVNATDNTAVDRVVFVRWDAVNEVYVTIAIDDQAPYQVTVSAADLNPTWNQIYAASYDNTENFSGWEWIWLYKLSDGALFSSSNRIVFIPFLLR